MIFVQTEFKININTNRQNNGQEDSTTTITSSSVAQQ